MTKKDNIERDDDLRSEYDIKDLKVRKVGSERKELAVNVELLMHGA